MQAKKMVYPTTAKHAEALRLKPRILNTVRKRKPTLKLIMPYIDRIICEECEIGAVSFLRRKEKT